MKNQTSFINPTIASLIEAKQEIGSILEETKTMASGLEEKEALWLQAIDEIDDKFEILEERLSSNEVFIKQAVKQMKVTMIIFISVVAASFASAFYFAFHK